MSNQHLKIRKGVRFTPQSTEPANPLAGDLYFNEVTGLRLYHNGVWQSAGGAGEVKVDLIDRVSTTLPATTVTLIDGEVVVDGDEVLFSNLTVNDDRVYKASVDGGGNITWSAQPAFQGFFDPSVADIVRVSRGNNYCLAQFIYDSSNEWLWSRVDLCVADFSLGSASETFGTGYIDNLIGNVFNITTNSTDGDPTISGTEQVSITTNGGLVIQPTLPANSSTIMTVDGYNGGFVNGVAIYTPGTALEIYANKVLNAVDVPSGIYITTDSSSLLPATELIGQGESTVLKVSANNGSNTYPVAQFTVDHAGSDSDCLDLYSIGNGSALVAEINNISNLSPVVKLKHSNLSAPLLRLEEAFGGNYIDVSIPLLTSNYTLKLPNAQASAAGSVMVNDASGILSWSRTGWVTSTVAGAGPFSPINYDELFIDTSLAAAVVNLPAAAKGVRVRLADDQNTWSTNNVTVNANGADTFDGAVGPLTLNLDGRIIELIGDVNNWRVAIIK